MNNSQNQTNFTPSLCREGRGGSSTPSLCREGRGGSCGSVDVILGLQWGDEGKGKVVDVLTPNYSVIARCQGGPNAGHTREFNGEKYVLRSIPSGIFQGDKVNIIGNGVVLDPLLFMT